MTDKENCHFPGFQVAHNLVQGSYFASRENGGRFIEDQELRSNGECLRNFDELPLGYAQLVDRRLWIKRQIKLFQQTTRPFMHLTPHNCPPARQLMPSENIFRNGEVREMLRLLVDRGDARFSCGTRILENPLTSLDHAPPLARLYHPAHYFHDDPF